MIFAQVSKSLFAIVPSVAGLLAIFGGEIPDKWALAIPSLTRSWRDMLQEASQENADREDDS